MSRAILASIGDGLGGGDQLPLGGGELPFQLLAVLHRLGQPDLIVGERRAQLFLLLADPFGLGLQLVGVAAGPLVVAGGAQMPQSLPGQLFDRAEPLLQGGELVPGVLGGGEQRSVLGQRGLQLTEPTLHLGVLGLDLHAPFPQRGLVGDLPVEGGPQGGQVVGEQPQPGVAQVGLDGGGTPGHLRLPAQWLELAAQLGGEVGHPVEVHLHRVELAQRLFLALAVLEDARGLLDERPAVLRLGVQHAVEPALADDDVHLPADAGVGQQLLDVQQSAGVAVDLVLALTRTEHPAGDGDLGVLDRQRAVGVVDGEGDLGTAQGARPAVPAKMTSSILPPRSAWPLLAEHPGDGVDDVGLAGAVRADHAGDPGLQLQRRGGGERLEAPHRQTLEIHLLDPRPVAAVPSPAARTWVNPQTNPMVGAGWHATRIPGAPGGSAGRDRGSVALLFRWQRVRQRPFMIGLSVGTFPESADALPTPPNARS
ncbi:hypothetical protein GCM10027614_65590 [Micromonospora vulcania]